MAGGEAKAALFDGLASVAQALGSGRRAEIVDVLAQGERSVDEIAAEISQTVANTSQHLQVLARAGLVRSRREGTRAIYRLASDQVAELRAAVSFFSMCARSASTRRVISPVPAPCQSTSSARSSRSCRGGGRSSPIAA